jgi:hypothetical protein
VPRYYTELFRSSISDIHSVESKFPLRQMIDEKKQSTYRKGTASPMMGVSQLASSDRIARTLSTHHNNATILLEIY